MKLWWNLACTGSTEGYVTSVEIRESSVSAVNTEIKSNHVFLRAALSVFWSSLLFFCIKIIPDRSSLLHLPLHHRLHNCIQWHSKKNRLLLRDEQEVKWGGAVKRRSSVKQGGRRWRWRGEVVWDGERRGGGGGGGGAGEGGIAGRWCHVFRLIAESSEAISKVQATDKHTTTH